MLIRFAGVLAFALLSNFSQAADFDVFSGTWEGKLNLTTKSKFFRDMPDSFYYRISIADDAISLAIAEVEGEYGEAGGAHALVSDVQVLTSFFNASPGFVETWSVSLVRMEEGTAYAYIMRTVNNYQVNPANEGHHFAVVAEGVMQQTQESLGSDNVVAISDIDAR